MKLILTDVDGVLTDGCVSLDVYGNESKRISYRDLDAVGIGRSAGFDFAFVTGEDTPMVSVLARRFNINIIYSAAKDKLLAMHQISIDTGLLISELLYIGDSDRDAPALAAVGLGIAPRDASIKALASAKIITERKGGEGVLLEVVDKLIAGQFAFPGNR